MATSKAAMDESLLHLWNAERYLGFDWRDRDFNSNIEAILTIRSAARRIVSGEEAAQ